MAVVSAAEAENLIDGTTVVVNAAKGELVVDPTEEIAAAEAAKSRAAAAKELRGNPAPPRTATDSAARQRGQAGRRS
ncbi:MAG: hypothetical protein ACLSUZ_04165 [Bifidobacterium pseudocatenulatum]